MVGESSSDHGASPVKLMQACLSTSKSLESSFDHDGSPVILVQTCLSGWKDLQSSFPYCGGTVKCVLTCFSPEMVRESKLVSNLRGAKKEYMESYVIYPQMPRNFGVP